MHSRITTPQYPKILKGHVDNPETGRKDAALKCSPLQPTGVSMTLKAMIESKMAERLESMSIADLLLLMEGDKGVAVQTAAAASNGDARAIRSAGAEPQTRASRKRGRGRNKVAYVKAIHKGRQRDPKAVAADLPAGNVRVTWLAIVNAKKPISALELEGKTALGKKAVESAVWALRNAGLVKSQPVAS